MYSSLSVGLSGTFLFQAILLLFAALQDQFFLDLEDLIVGWLPTFKPLQFPFSWNI